MPVLQEVFELVDGEVHARQMYPVDIDHAIKADPERWFRTRPQIAREPAPVEDPATGEGVTELPGLPRKPGRPRKDDGAG